MPSLHNEPYRPPKPPKHEETKDGKLMTVLSFPSGIECQIRRLSDRYFGVFEFEHAVVMTKGHDSLSDARDSAEKIANIVEEQNDS